MEHLEKRSSIRVGLQKYTTDRYKIKSEICRNTDDELNIEAPGLRE